MFWFSKRKTEENEACFGFFMCSFDGWYIVGMFAVVAAVVAVTLLTVDPRNTKVIIISHFILQQHK